MHFLLGIFHKAVSRNKEIHGARTKGKFLEIALHFRHKTRSSKEDCTSVPEQDFLGQMTIISPEAASHTPEPGQVIVKSITIIYPHSNKATKSLLLFTVRDTVINYVLRFNHQLLAAILRLNFSISAGPNRFSMSWSTTLECL